MSDSPADAYGAHFAAEKLEQAVDSVLIAYRLTLTGVQTVVSTPWHRDETLPRYAVRVRTGDDEITLSVADWGDRLDDVGPFLRAWIHDRVHLERARLKRAPDGPTRTGSPPGTTSTPGDERGGTQ